MRIDSEDRVSDCIAYSIKHKQTIVQLARGLGYSISKTSRLLGIIAKEKEHFAILFKKLNWPINVYYGHIYTGAFATQLSTNSKGEVSGGSLVAAERGILPGRSLKPGDHVLTSKPVNKNFTEIFAAKPTVQKLFYLGNPILVNGKREFDLVMKVWLSKRDVARGKLDTLGKNNSCKIYIASKRTRIGHVRGEWLGTPSKLSIVSVTSDFK